jgi:hypothetical protein
MKTEEDEAFDERARRQGMWGGGFPAKRAMAADKQEPAQELSHIVQSNGKHSPLLTHMMSKRTTPPVAPVQEPTGMLHIDRLGQWLDASLKERKRPWAGLTDEEREQHRNDWHSNIHDKEFYAIEAKLKEKNG